MESFLNTATPLEILLALSAINFGALIFIMSIHKSRTFEAVLDKLTLVTPALLAPVAASFIFLSAFLGNSVWGNFQAHTVSIKNERTDIISFSELLKDSDYLKSSGLDNYLKSYVESAVIDEWPLLKSKAISQITSEKFNSLMRQTLIVAQDVKTSPVLSGMLVKQISQLQFDRRTRIGFRWQSFDAIKGYEIIFLGFLLQFVTMVLHVGAPQRVAAVFTTSLITAIVFSYELIVALTVDNYSDLFGVSIEPLTYALSKI